MIMNGNWTHFGGFLRDSLVHNGLSTAQRDIFLVEYFIEMKEIVFVLTALLPVSTPHKLGAP